MLLLAAIAAAPVDQVASMALEGSQAAADLSFFGLIMQADWVVKTIMLMLAVASVWSWAVIFDRWVVVSSIKAKCKAFEKAFWNGQSLENLFERVRGRESHPMALIFSSAMLEWQSRNIRDISTNNNLRVGTRERVYQAMQVAINKSLDEMEKNLGFLANIGSCGTFVGLFGTIWGIMVSFQSIALTKNTTLAVVAPGIAEALLATAFGLIAAIPAMLFYNKFSNDINRISNKLEDFSNELGAIISKELDSIQ